MTESELPQLSLSKCFAVFDKAKMGNGVVAELAGVSRMSVYLWRRGGRKPLSFLHDAVSTLAYVVFAALKAGKLPLPKSAQIEQYRAVLDPIRAAGPDTWINHTTK